MSGLTREILAPAGSTGNNTHASVGVNAVPSLLAVEFVETAGSASVTFKLQGTFDRMEEAADGAANWFDLILLPSDSETPVLSLARSTLGATCAYVAKKGEVRFVPRVRLVTSANSGATYTARLWQRYAI